MSLLIEDAVNDPVLVVTGPQGRLKDQFVGLVTLIGRSPDADVCLPSEEVDELHCLLTQTSAGLVAKDCFTSAGLFVNGDRVTEALLNDGDELEIGPYRLRVKLPSNSEVELSTGQAQQELIQQMAKRIAALEAKRQSALRRAWRLRRKRGAPSAAVSVPVAGLQRTLTPFGSPEQSRFNALEAELAAERRRCTALEAELQRARGGSASGWDVAALPGESALEAELRAEVERLKAALAERKFRSEDQEAEEGLREYEQQLNDFRDQLSRDAEDLQLREEETAQRAEEVRIAEEQLQTKIADTEKELAAERARVKREQSQLERMVAECRQDLEEMMRQAENIERDEKYQRLRSQIRGHRDEKDTTEPPTVSERIQRFLKGLGG